MAELQKTIDGDWVPTAPHPDDIVECSDGRVCSRRDALVDCDGGYHSDDEDRHEANVEIVSEFLDGVDKWSEKYHTEDGDYADGASYIVDEVSYDWPGRVEEWIEGEYGDNYGHTNHDDYLDELVKHVCERLDSDDCESEYNASEYACYSGDGCCLYSLDIGECEDQIEINKIPALKHLHDCGELDDVLDNINCDAWVRRSYRREKDEETGYYMSVGRETYMPYGDRDDPDLLVGTAPGGQWQYVVPAEKMRELVEEFLADRADRKD